MDLFRIYTTFPCAPSIIPTIAAITVHRILVLCDDGTGPGDDEGLTGVNLTGRTSVLIRAYGANLYMRNICDLHVATG